MYKNNIFLRKLLNQNLVTITSIFESSQKKTPFNIYYTYDKIIMYMYLNNI